jgi:tetratricopeptide (TPR) repeat protein/tRNA A-37 threonylcarbamoyl transferase component Bud32
MTPEMWERLKSLFNAAIEMPPNERQAFVENCCAGEPELRTQLVGMIAAHQVLDVETAPGVKGLLQALQQVFSPSQVVLGRFQIIRLVGSGGMGDVYEAVDQELNQTVALKTIRTEIADSSAAFSRFKREVLLARRVSGPNVCRIHELFRLESGQETSQCAFIAMEFLNGITLADRLKTGGPIPWQEALSIAREICAGLTAIHDAGIVHRDLKTRNIMLVGKPDAVRAVLMDFGLARETASTADGVTAMTITGAVMGTPSYMAPEQFEGKEITSGADIFALGIVLHEMVTTKNPFAATTLIQAAMMRREPPNVSSLKEHGVPRQWEHVIRRCLDYLPEHRFQSAKQVIRALEAGPFSVGGVVTRRPWNIRIGALLAVSTLFIGIAAWWNSYQVYKPTPLAERWYEQGLEALHEANYLKATRLFSKALETDQKFPMAHARLAEAWANMDFDGIAQSHLLTATTQEEHLSSTDHLYFNAIRATLTHDWTTALADYRQLLDRLPAPDKVSGYVDLGMAFERANDPESALESFTKASSLNRSSPAPPLQAAILETRLNRLPEADRDFNAANSLYETEINPEGEAELDYQRGYLANEREQTDLAKTYLNRSLDEARKLPSVQLEIRALTQLSSVAYNSGDLDNAQKNANAAIQLARDNQLPGWAADGLVRLASAELRLRNYAAADKCLDDATSILRKDPQDRVSAMANLTRASLRNQQHLNKEILDPAEAAAAYYTKNGYIEEAAFATILVGRAQRNLGQWQDALHTANKLVQLSQDSQRNGLLVQSRELEGSIYLAKEDYPHALQAYNLALALARDEPLKSFELLHCADALWRIGRSSEAGRMLDSIPQPNSSAGEIRVENLLAQQKYSEAALAAAETITKVPEMPPDRMRGLQLDRIFAMASRGRLVDARRQIEGLLEKTGAIEDRGDQATFNMGLARVYLRIGDAGKAFAAAIQAESYFASKGQPDSDLQSSLLVAEAARTLHNAEKERTFSKKCFDIKTELGNTWPNSDLQSYFSRPDLVSRFRALRN